MNLSTPNLSLGSSRCSANSNATKAAGAPVSTSSPGGFEEVFAGLARAADSSGGPPEKGGVKASAVDSPEKTGAELDESSQAGTDTEINLKKKKGGEATVPEVLVQLLEPMPAQILQVGSEAPLAGPNEAADPAVENEASVGNAKPATFPLSLPVVGGSVLDTGKAPTTAAVAGAESSPVEVQAALTAEPKVEPQPRAKSPPFDAPVAADAPAPTEEKLAKTLAATAVQMPVNRSRRLAEETKKLLAADFAENSPQGIADGAPAKSGVLKNFLRSADKIVANLGDTLGTNVANPTTEMSSLPATPISENVFLKNTLSARVDAAAADFSAQNPTGASAPLFTGAQHAIEAVLEAGERFTTEAQRAVKMEFSVSGEDLSVHVEMHAGEVRTTFHTASAELRSALAHEWQVLAAGESGRAQRFADPVFSTGSAATTAQGNGGESQGNHRGQEMNQPRERFEFSQRPGGGSPARGADLPVNLPTAVPLTALRLHTFA